MAENIYLLSSPSSAVLSCVKASLNSKCCGVAVEKRQENFTAGQFVNSPAQNNNSAYNVCSFECLPLGKRLFHQLDTHRILLPTLILGVQLHHISCLPSLFITDLQPLK